MGLFSNWKPHTIAGKILKGVVSIGSPVAAAVTGVGAVGGMIAGVGAATGVATAAKTIAKVVTGGVTATGRAVSTVAEAAANIVTGTTKDQRKMIQEQKAETKSQVQKLEVIQKLIDAGASVQDAAAKVGVPLSQLAGLFGLPSESDKLVADTVKEKTDNGNKNSMPIDTKKLVILGAIGLAGLFLLPKLKRF